MSALEQLFESFVHSIENLWMNTISFAPTFFGALVVLVIGYFVSTFLGKFVEKIVSITRVDKVSEKIGVKKEVKNYGFDLNFGVLMGWIVKWFFLIVTFVAVVDILNIRQLTLFLEKLVLYLPNVIVAVIILAVGLIVGNILKEAVEKTTQAFVATKKLSSMLGSLAKWSVFVFALMASLVQLGVAAELIQILFTGFVLMVAIAGGLSFGLGGKDHASKILDWVQGEVRPKK